MNESKQGTADQKFRESLEDAGLVVTKLSAVCGTFDEMLQIIELALQNDAQLKIVMNLVLEKKK